MGRRTTATSLDTDKKNTSNSNKRRARKKTTKKKSHVKSTSRARRALHVRENLSISDGEHICTKTDPMPEAYVFVPRGDPYITRHCKSRSKDAAETVYIVYDKSGRDQLGIRVPKEIHNEVTKSASQTAEDRAAAVRSRDARDQKKARLVLEETFPSMPEKCVQEILQHAFLKGSGRVGRISTRSEQAKATLAAEAHIRHNHTSYEKLLDGGIDRESARDTVWDLVQDIRDQWARKLVVTT